MSRAISQTEGRWRRVLQPSTVPYDSDNLIGGNITVDPEVASANDLARFVEIVSESPFMAGVLLSTDPDRITPTTNYWTANVFTWNSDGTRNEPSLFADNYARYNDESGLLVAPLKLTLAVEGSAPLEIWNCLVFDSERGVVDRIDPQPDSKKDLDDWITSCLEEQGIRLTYRSPDTTGTIYRDLAAVTIIPFDSPRNVQYNMWTWWLLYLRLFFADFEHEEVFAELGLRLGEGASVANLLLDFYPRFTSDANVHTFGSIDFVETYPSRQDLWRYESALMKRVDMTTRSPWTDYGLARLLSAALRTFIETDELPKPFESLYHDYMNVVPRYAPKCQDCGGWIPYARMSAGLKRMLFGSRSVPACDGSGAAIEIESTVRFGYFILPSNAGPYVFLKDGELTGFDYDLGNELMRIISDYYYNDSSVEVKASWHRVDVTDTSATGTFAALYDGLEGNCYDVAMSGQMVLSGKDLPQGTDPEWTCPTALIFTGITYTGKEKEEIWGAMKPVVENPERATFVEAVVGLIEKGMNLTFFSVINPGPSPGSTQNLVSDINAVNPKAPGRAMWVTGTVDDAATVMADATFHFSVGDGIASAWLANPRFNTFNGIYLNTPAVDKPSIYYDPAVRSATLLPIAAFTLKNSTIGS